MRILLHPGFHKTGTSSLQRGALACARDLEPHMRLLLTPDIQEASRAARRYSAQPSTQNMALFSTAFEAVIGQLETRNPRAFLLSSEDLSGYLPGLRGVMTYHAAPALAGCAVAVLRAHFGPQAHIILLYTTRDPEPWLKSLYWQNLRAQRLTEDFETFRARLAPAADLAGVVGQVRDLVQSEAEVHGRTIETCGATPLGPLGEALDLLGLPKDHLPPLPRHNRQPQEAARELLALNRSILPDQRLAAAKRDLLRKLRKAPMPDS